MASNLPTLGAVPVTNEKGQTRMEKVKVKRYVPGKRPDYAADEESEEEADDDERVGNEGTSEALVDVKPEDLATDRRLRRLMLAQQKSTAEREVYEGEVVVSRRARRRSTSSEDSDADDIERPSRPTRKVPDANESDDEALAKRREALRARAQESLTAQQPVAQFASDESDASSGEESSSGESGSEEESDDGHNIRLRPVFVSKKNRVTLAEREKLEADAVEAEENRVKKLENQKKETQRIVGEIVKADVFGPAENSDSDQEDVISDGDGDEEEEYEKWKVRELQRIQRDRDEEEARVKELLEMQRRSEMTEEQLAVERKQRLMDDAESVPTEKANYRYLQKYYHKGAFYTDEAKGMLKKHDYTAATGEDVVDKTILPKVMQVKNFGRSGRTKYTHLREADTSAATPWDEQTSVSVRIQNKLASGKNDMTRPGLRKKQ